MAPGTGVAVLRPPVLATPTTPVGRVESAGASAVAAVDGLFEVAFRAHHGELLGFLLHVTRDTGAAEDLLQETFLRLYRELQAGRPPHNVRAWLYRVAANLTISRGRRTSVARRWLERATHPDESVDSPERTTVAREDREHLLAELAALPRDARVGLLMAASGFSGHEIAVALDRTDVATRTMLCRARVRLRQRLAAR